MAYGVKLINSTGSLVISSDHYGLGYLGNATFTGVRKPLSYSQTAGANTYIDDSADPFYAFQITSVYPPVAFTPVNASFRYVVTSISNVGGNTWEIVVGSTAAGFATPPLIKCFARLAGPGSPGWGLRVWDGKSPNSRTWDTTANMLIIKQRDDWPAYFVNESGGRVETIPLVGFTAPYVMHRSYSGVSGVSSVSVGGSRFEITDSTTAWSGSTTTLSRSSRGVTLGKYRDDGNPSYNRFPADRSYVIEGANYP